MNKDLLNNNTKSKHKEEKISQCPCLECKSHSYFRQILQGTSRLSATEVENIEKSVERMIKILKSHKDPYQKKLDLFNLVKKIEVGEIEPSEERRINILYQGKIYNELAKQTLRDYKKLTAEEFGKTE